MVGRLTLLNGYISRLKEVRAYTVGLVRSVGFSSIDVRYDIRCSIFNVINI